MIQKSIYQAPEVEQFEVQIESALLNLSDGSGAASASAMSEDTTTFNAWD